MAHQLVNDCEGCFSKPMPRDKDGEIEDERCYDCRHTPSCTHEWDRVVVHNSFRTAYQPRVSSVCINGDERIICQHPHADTECAPFWAARAMLPEPTLITTG